MTDSRTEILRRIRAALRDVPPAEDVAGPAVPREYQTVDRGPLAHRLDCFVERVIDYGATVHRVLDRDLAAAIEAACVARGVHRLVIPPDLPTDWIPSNVTPLRDEPASQPGEPFNSGDGVLTGCALAIAQTGTIVLDSGPRQGRRLITLLPDYHLCVVRADQVVGLVPEAVAQLRQSAGNPDRPITWISGPSATSDIELNRVEGVHGPRTLEVILVEPGESAHGDH